MNCWQLCQKYYSDVRGISLDYSFEYDTDNLAYNCSLIKVGKKDFKKVTKPEVGDLIIIKVKGIESHIAVYLGEGLFLHTTKTTGSCVDRIARWKSMIEGYYRHGSI